MSLRYVKLFSYKCARALQQAREESHAHKYNYYYGFQIIYGEINKILLLIAASLILQTLIPTLVATGSFVIIRMFAGGLHFKSYTRCAWVSLISLLACGFLSVHSQYNFLITGVIYSTVFLIFILYAPVENKNRPIRENERPKFKVIAIVSEMLLFVPQLFLTNISIKNAILFGVLLAGIIVLPIVNKLE